MAKSSLSVSQIFYIGNLYLELIYFMGSTKFYIRQLELLEEFLNLLYGCNISAVLNFSI
jgi:hypothetical protein